MQVKKGGLRGRLHNIITENTKTMFHRNYALFCSPTVFYSNHCQLKKRSLTKIEVKLISLRIIEY